MEKSNKKVIVLVGQTGIGKTDLSLKLCNAYNGEIINCDASQMKRDLNIGTAKINLSETNIKHHMIDIIAPDEKYSCADYQREARKLIDKITSEGKIPFIVGGTGLYACSVIYDYDLSVAPNNSFNDDLYNKLTNDELYDILLNVDYESSLKIHKNNRQRVIRAIEYAKSGNKLSDNKGKKDLVYDALIICLRTSTYLLYSRIEARVDKMIDDGFIEEVKSLIDKGYDLFKVSDIGYRPIYLYLQNKYTYDEVVSKIKEDSRHYAKRQMTWFKHQMNCNFIEMDYNNENISFVNACRLIDDFLSN